jgi:predicted Zn-dependent protease
MLAQAAGGTGANHEAHKALADYYYLTGNPHAAIEQLQLASRFAGDNFYLQSSLEARIAAIREELKTYQEK